MNSGILKFTADYLHDGTALLRDHVLITDAGGKVVEIVPTGDAGGDVQSFDGLLCPGFINAHCHLELSHLWKKIPEHTGLVNFLIAVMRERDATAPEEILQAARKAQQAMEENGIVAVGDVSNKTDSLPVKQQGNLFYHTFVEAIGFSDTGAGKRMVQALKVREDFRHQGLAASIVPHAPYSVSASLFRLINQQGAEAIISIHNQETTAEDELYLGDTSDFYRLYENLHLPYDSFRSTGKSSLQSWLPYFDQGQSLILVHNTFTGEEDLLFAVKSNHPLYWCLCPKANDYIENRMPPVEQLLRHHVKIVLGTDSLASNHQLSILEEMKTLQRHFHRLSLETMLRWATLNGAEALGCSATFGSFENGKRPGIVNLCPLSKASRRSIALVAGTRAHRIK
jgi:cytosine/adenosine deaminase-related metal-dependent hydrolase